MDLRLTAVSAAQAGAVLRRQVLAAGISDDEISRRIRSGTWIAIRRGAYVERSAWRAMSAAARHRAHVHAVVASLTGPVVVSHTSAAVMLGLPTWGLDLSTVHVTRPPGVSTRTEAGVWHHSARLPDDQVIEIDGMAITHPARTVVDTARVTDFEPSVVVADAALRADLTTSGELLETVDHMRDWPGARNAGRVVEFADGRAESVGESRGRVCIDAGGLPQPDLQVVITDGPDGFTARVDYLFTGHRTIGEFNGRVKYGRSDAPGLDPGTAVWLEKLREDRLRAMGFEVVRFIWVELSRPDLVASRFRQAFARAAQRTHA
ncbi:MAG TPA: type IV toxin-antitoxin system AbiEi family antitoxin domain-containing protein [Jiangellaceae bacterium]